MLIVAPDDGWDSLVSLADADAYHARMGSTEWAGGTESARESALRRAAQFIKARGVFPRYLNPVHANVRAAACEAALRALDGTLYEDVEAQAVTQETVGPISVSYTDRGTWGRRRFPIIDDLLQGLALGSGQIPVMRA